SVRRCVRRGPAVGAALAGRSGRAGLSRIGGSAGRETGVIQSVKQTVAAIVLAACIVAVACVDMSAPKGPASISVLQFPSLYVVKGDTMRDTNGVAMAPSVISYDAAGNVLSDATAQFFITDSLPAAHFANGKLFGDTIGTVHIIGQVGN